MASLTSSSRRSSSSYHSSSRYSTSSSYRSEGSLGGSSDSLDPLFEPFLDSADHPSLFGEEGPGGPSCLAPFGRHSRTSYGHTGCHVVNWQPVQDVPSSRPVSAGIDSSLSVALQGEVVTAPVGGAVTGRQSSTGGGVRCLGDSYYISADVSQFEPHDVVVMAYNHHVVIHAQKVLDDGSVSDTFTHKSLFPEDMDPLSVSGTLNPDGILVVSVRRTTTLGGPESLGVPIYCSEAHL